MTSTLRTKYILAAIACRIDLVWPTHQSLAPRNKATFAIWHPADPNSGAAFDLLASIGATICQVSAPDRAVVAECICPVTGRRRKSQPVLLADHYHDVVAASRMAVLDLAADCGQVMINAQGKSA